jgi:thioredoxin-related protein
MQLGQPRPQSWWFSLRVLSLWLLLPISSVWADTFVVFERPQQLHPDRVLVLVAEIENCSFCERVKQDFLLPLSLNKQWSSRFQVARIDLDSPQKLVDFVGQTTSQKAFAASLGADFSPTLMFLNPLSGARVGEDIVGLVTPDFYGFYLQQQIARAHEQLSQ